MSGNDSSTSDSSSESGSSSEEEQVLQRPVFIKKNKAGAKAPAPKSSEIAIARAEYQQHIDSKEAKKDEFDGVDDTDNVDPEDEYNQWKLREIQRMQRDRRKLQEQEEEKEELIRRQMNGKTKAREETTHQSVKGLGSFYTGDIDEKLLKRNYKDVEDSGDHSRPTKYKAR